MFQMHKCQNQCLSTFLISGITTTGPRNDSSSSDNCKYLIEMPSALQLSSALSSLKRHALIKNLLFDLAQNSVCVRATYKNIPLKHDNSIHHVTQYFHSLVNLRMSSNVCIKYFLLVPIL